MVTSEAAPFAKTGGLGDVAGSLPKALRQAGADVRVIMPQYGLIADKYKNEMTFIRELSVPVAWRRQYCGLKRLDWDGVPFYFIDNLYYFQRSSLYGFFDEGERWAYFCRAVLEALTAIDFSPDILHCHDWQSGLTVALLRAHYQDRPLYQGIRTLFTVHNLKYQGVFGKEIMDDVLDLGWEFFTEEGVEFYDQVSFMKSGLAFADAVSTVSRTYAAEIQTPFYGENLDGLLRRRSQELYGIINGIDYSVYDPAADPFLECPYHSDDQGKAANKAALQRELGLDADPALPVMAIVSRLVSQKGLDLIACVLDEIMAMGVEIVIVGTGEEKFQQFFGHAAYHRYPRRMSVKLLFDERLARRVYAGADLLLMPSLFEPCGISQLIAMRYGTLPLVRETGGLKDTVIPFNEFDGSGNGFSFTNYNAHDMLYTLRRALDFYQEKDSWKRLVANAMQCDFSWNSSSKQYIALYEKLKSEEAVHGS